MKAFAREYAMKNPRSIECRLWGMALQQMTHVTAQMNVYKDATIEFEAEYLAFYALDLQQQAIIAACRAGKPC